MARKKLTPPTARRRSRSKVRSINFGWWGTIALIVLLGVVAIVVSRGEQASADIVRDVTAPSIGDAATVTVSSVEVEDFDRVEAGDTLMTVSAGGVTEEVTAPTTGIVAGLLVAEGDEVEPGNRLAIVQTGPDFRTSNAAGHHWHTAYGVYVCDNFLPPVGEFPGNLHSHGDGLFHAHPLSTSEAGDNATMGRWFENAGLHLDIDELEYSDGNTYQSGEVDCGDETGVLRWSLNGTEQDDNPANYVIGNGDVVVIAFVPEGEDFPTLPPSATDMAENYARPNHPDFEQPADEPAEDGDGETTTTTAAADGNGDGG